LIPTRTDQYEPIYSQRNYQALLVRRTRHRLLAVQSIPGECVAPLVVTHNNTSADWLSVAVIGFARKGDRNGAFATDSGLVKAILDEKAVGRSDSIAAVWL